MKKFRIALAAMAVSAGAPVWAQTASVTVADPAPVDSARLTAAKVVIDQVWPLGTYERIMRSAVDQIVNGSLASMYDMKVDDFTKGMAASPDDKKYAGKTFREMMAAEDPYFEERSRRSMKVMMDEMIPLMSEVEPDVRIALSNAYARRFTVAQLNDLHAFFDTPTGRIYAAESMTLMMGPDMMKAMQGFTPKLVQRMPAIMAKVEAATKDLPPPKGKKTS